MQPRIAEGLDFAVAEHLDLAPHGGLVVRLIGAQLERARATALGRSADLDLRNRIEAPEECALHADVAQVRRCGVLGQGLLILGIGGQLFQGGLHCPERCVAGQDQEKRRLRGDRGAKKADGTDARAAGGGHIAFGQETRRALHHVGLAVAHVVVAQLEEGILGSLLGGGNRDGAAGGRGKYLSARHRH